MSSPQGSGPTMQNVSSGPTRLQGNVTHTEPAASGLSDMSQNKKPNQFNAFCQSAASNFLSGALTYEAQDFVDKGLEEKGKAARPGELKKALQAARDKAFESPKNYKNSNGRAYNRWTNSAGRKARRQAAANQRAVRAKFAGKIPAAASRVAAGAAGAGAVNVGITALQRAARNQSLTNSAARFQYAKAFTNSAIGGAAGALAGFAVGGPVGAGVGFVAGIIGGAAAENMNAPHFYTLEQTFGQED